MRSVAFVDLCDTIRKYRDKKVAITFHTIGDRDSVGSAVALSQCFTNATVVTPDFITNNARRMLAYLKYEDVVRNELPSDADLIIIVDANNFFAIGRLQPTLEKSLAAVLLIDHHAPHDHLPVDVMIFNDESYSATASIIYELMKTLGTQITKEIAILLLNGIVADSANLQNSSPKTFKQISELLSISKLNFSFFTEYFRESIPVKNKYEVIEEVTAAKREIVGRYIIIYGRASEHANVAADTALGLNADASVFWVTSKTEASISARLRPNLEKELHIHLGLIMQEIAPIVGGNGGGHAAAAGAYGPKKGAAQKAGEEVVKKIKEKMQV